MNINDGHQMESNEIVENSQNTQDNQKNQNSSKKPKVIYIYDAMCGWCFAFSGVMNDIYQKYKNDFEFEILSGGMLIGNGVTPAYKMADFILQAHKRVEKISGVKFGEKYLDLFREGSYVLNSELSAKVLTSVKDWVPELTFSIVKDIQYAHFVNGHTLNSMITFDNILNKYSLNLTEINKKVISEEVHIKTFAEFDFVKKLGVSGFPAVLLLHNDKYYSITSGYTKYEDIDQIMNSIINNLEDIQ